MARARAVRAVGPRSAGGAGVERGAWDCADLQIAVRALDSSGVAVRAMEHAGKQPVGQAQALARFAQAHGH
jgi:hypothetical protein